MANGITRYYPQLEVVQLIFGRPLSQNDDQAAEQLQKERSKLFKTINERDLKSG
jgi:hypothetical protein